MRYSYVRQPVVLAALLAVVLAEAFITAGCGANSPVHAPAPKSANRARAPRVAAISIQDPPADPITAALVPKAVRHKGSITVAMDAANPPDEFIGRDGHTIVGMDAELGEALGDEMGIRWNLVNASAGGIAAGLRSGRYDVGLSSFRDNAALPRGVAFVTYFKAGESFYVRAGGALGNASLARLCGKTVAVVAGTAEQAQAARQSTRCTAASEPAVRVLVYPSAAAAGRAVASGKADSGFADAQVATYVVGRSSGALKLSGPAVNPRLYAIAVRGATGGLAAAVLAALRALTVDGVYTRILASWGMANAALTDPVIHGAKS